MNTLTKAHPVRTTVLTIALTTALLLSTLPLSALASSDRDDKRGEDRASSSQATAQHYPFFLEQLHDRYGWLPPGLMKLLERYHGAYGNGRDNTDPKLKNVDEAAATTTATLKTTFNEPVKVTLFVSDESGFTKNDEGVMKQASNKQSKLHTFNLDELEAGTEYFYFLSFKDKSGNKVVSDEMSFTTSATTTDDDTDDSTNPTLDDTDVMVGTTTATVTLNFSEDVQARLFLSTDDGFATTDSGVTRIPHTTLMDEHMFALTSLTPDTTHYFRVEFRDEAGNRVLSEQSSFTTGALPVVDTTDPVISNLVGTAGTSTISASWMTNEPTTAKVYTSTVSGFGTSDAGVIVTTEPTLKTDHELLITGLATSTVYYHLLEVEDASGNTTITAQQTLGTL